jgi:hypothetical protein
MQLQALVPSLNVVMLLALGGVLLLRMQSLSAEGSAALVMSLASISYYAPFLLVLHHPEVRYVYPPSALIPCPCRWPG